MNKIQKERLFSEVYHEWVQPLFRFAYYNTKDRQSAEDLVQEVFAKYWDKMDKIGKGKEKSYLYTSIKNLWLNKVEHRKIVLRFETTHKESKTVSSPHYQLEMKEFRIKLEKAIAKLSEGQREVFLMNRIEGLKYREIAARLEISQKAVEKRMSQALLQLRKIHNRV